MARTIPPDRLERLVSAATTTFVARGYRLTQMGDVAETLGVAKGTLYLYVASKEALFDAAVRYADGLDALPPPSALPLPTPPAGGTAKYVRDRLAEEASGMLLGRALADPGGELGLGEIVRDLYRRMWRHRKALKLVDRCAADHPDLRSAWFDEGRYAQVALLASFVERRAALGKLRPTLRATVTARLILETLALWAIHMPWDPAPQGVPADEMEDAVIDQLVHAYESPRSP